MATAKVERLLNLVICLLHTRQYVTAEYIRANVAGYSDDGQSLEAFNRMFERDKTELRDLGIPLVTGRSPMSGGAEGYRIDRGSYELPEVSLDADEAATIAMAAALWDTPEVSTLSQTAILKLRAAGFPVRSEDDLGISTGGSARSMGSEVVIGALLTAIDAGQAVEFTHRSGSASAPTTRTLEPWGVVTHRGRWYVVGHDRDRDATRTFRLSRISDLHAIGEPGASRCRRAPICRGSSPRPWAPPPDPTVVPHGSGWPPTVPPGCAGSRCPARQATSTAKPVTS